ncbi:MAG: dihydroneopterin aldolase family protein [Candidatus Thermoplasmatota archaeon]|nr:dihydroneopterin aldolase family protein [Candidatus Thermoplasmatota archaeon]
MVDPATRYFSCSDKERAIFEAGVKLGSIYHQYTGIPINDSNVEFLERAIEKAVSAQPFVTKVKVSIDRRKVGRSRPAYKYKTLLGDMMDVKINIRYGKALVEGRMAWVSSMKYPLMRFKVLKE